MVFMEILRKQDLLKPFVLKYKKYDEIKENMIVNLSLNSEKLVYKKTLTKYINNKKLELDLKIKLVQRNKKTIELKDIEKYFIVSICGEYDNSFGQIDLNNIIKLSKNNKLNYLLSEIKDIWKEVHLNDLNAGTDKQNTHLKKRKVGHLYSNFNEEVEELKKVNLYNDRGYNFGSSWLVKELSLKQLDKVVNLFNEVTE